MAIVVGSSALMLAILLTGSEVFAMDKKLFFNEITFQVTINLARKMLNDKLITKKEYQSFKKEMLHKYQPFFGGLYT